jgi:hypothetical protein
MAGYSKLYVVGGLGGILGADGVNPIAFQILVGDADRQWLEAHYFDPEIKPLGQIRSIIPAGPDYPDALLDACIAFFPQHFASCRSMAEVKSTLKEAKALDFHLGRRDIPYAWGELREEARPLFRKLNIWKADLVPLQKGEDV